MSHPPLGTSNDQCSVSQSHQRAWYLWYTLLGLHQRIKATPVLILVFQRINLFKVNKIFYTQYLYWFFLPDVCTLYLLLKQHLVISDKNENITIFMAVILNFILFYKAYTANLTAEMNVLLCNFQLEYVLKHFFLYIMNSQNFKNQKIFTQIDNFWHCGWVGKGGGGGDGVCVKFIKKFQNFLCGIMIVRSN